jgi:hypothetical protein
MRTQTIARLVLLSGFVLLPGAGWAQSPTTGAIAGVMKDTTGAVLPGVTVGFEAAVNARFRRGGLLSGGVNTGQTVADNCAMVDSPDQRFCENTLPWRGQTQVKFNGVYPLPWDLQASAVFQNLPGIPIAASYVATNAQIAPTLGRNLGSCSTRVPCTGTLTLNNLFEPNTRFEDRLTQVDVRLTKIVRSAGAACRGCSTSTIYSTRGRFSA